MNGPASGRITFSPMRGRHTAPMRSGRLAFENAVNFTVDFVLNNNLRLLLLLLLLRLLLLRSGCQSETERPFHLASIYGKRERNIPRVRRKSKAIAQKRNHVAAFEAPVGQYGRSREGVGVVLYVDKVVLPAPSAQGRQGVG